jgi:hypothetical protein
MELSAPDEDFCPFLADNSCTIYPVRPITCRTHGLPIRSASLTGGSIDCCPLNFTERDLSIIEKKYVLDIDMITDNLMRLNLAFCLISGNTDRAAYRVPLCGIADTTPETAQKKARDSGLFRDGA